MGWQTHDGRCYFYLAIRREGRPRNIYMGSGTQAELAAAKLEQSRSRRYRDRMEILQIQDELRPLDNLINTLDEGASRLLEASLLGEGYYRDNRRWRGARRVRALSSSR